MQFSYGSTVAKKYGANNSQNLKHFGSIAVVVFVLFWLFPWNVFYIPGLDLDRSWAMALHMAIDKNMVFGQDFIFTYGPLGYITTRYPIGISKFQILIL